MKKSLSATDQAVLYEVLKQRFETNMNRHQDFAWEQIQHKLEENPAKVWSLHQMEQSGGEPDVIGIDPVNGAYLFVDCAEETPKGRRSLCFDQAALDSRKENKPVGSAMETAKQMGVELLTEEQYRQLQTLGQFDLKTSSWIQTPANIRKLGGALFCDRRYDHVFTYHNGAISYYAARGFRAILYI
ncbi:DUF4256 domain-containing protein [Sphingobacterium sp.]|uniref:DUF4256 domain-containing protein n=1 Tax=Sphingobacterium sp. TaxID=341027 RepID=UPI0031D2627C